LPAAATEVDVLIAGAGPAGCAAAISLAQFAPDLRVALVDGAPAAAARIGETVPPPIRPMLEHVGLWDRFAADVALRLVQHTERVGRRRPRQQRVHLPSAPGRLAARPSALRRHDGCGGAHAHRLLCSRQRRGSCCHGAGVARHPAGRLAGDRPFCDRCDRPQCGARRRDR
jgi:NADPH-dependent 2,4-dienoyl-CoA reductase/sulfur reductase-like enzyme